jgi:hypothetical protein
MLPVGLSTTVAGMFYDMPHGTKSFLCQRAPLADIETPLLLSLDLEGVTGAISLVKFAFQLDGPKLLASDIFQACHQ